MQDYVMVRRTVFSYLKQGNYTQAAEILKPVIELARSQNDWGNWIEFTGILQVAYLDSGQKDEAKSLLVKSIAECPECFYLYEKLADISWISDRNPAEALRIMEDYLATHEATISLEYQIQTRNYLARLYAATEEEHKAVECIKWVVNHLPDFSPPKAYLFDVATIKETFQAGIRAPILAEYINRIEDPHWLIDPLSRPELEYLKQEISSRCKPKGS